MTFNDYCINVSKIFSQNKWISYEFDNTSLEKTMNLGKDLSNEQRDLLVYLLNKYVQIPPSQYITRILNVLSKIDTNSIKNINKIYIAPLKKPEDFLLPKSSDYVSYQFKMPVISNSAIFNNREVIITSINCLPKDLQNSSVKKLFLVDDFSGSGETVFSCLDYLKQEKQILGNKITILLLAGMKDSINKIQQKGYEVYCDLIQEKGISSIIDDIKRNDFTILMNEIEAKYHIDINSEIHFGYNHSESLITLIRTPNNTFPIFWDSTKVKNAPFKRN